jgi:hypothetical protein
MELGQQVRGKVTYKGEPVPYGYVLFYRLGMSIDVKTGAFVPSAFGEIHADGTYEVANAPTGPVQITVVTDPDLDLLSIVKPETHGGPVPGTAPPGGPRGPGAPPGNPSGPPPGKEPHGPAGKPHVGPIRPPPLPPGAAGSGSEEPPRPGHPRGRDLTDDQKKTLKEINDKYGSIEKTQLHYVVRQGEQTCDLQLK